MVSIVIPTGPELIGSAHILHNDSRTLKQSVRQQGNLIHVVKTTHYSRNTKGAYLWNKVIIFCSCHRPKHFWNAINNLVIRGHCHNHARWPLIYNNHFYDFELHLAETEYVTLNYIVNLNVDNENKIFHCLLNDVICLSYIE